MIKHIENEIRAFMQSQHRPIDNFIIHQSETPEEYNNLNIINMSFRDIPTYDYVYGHVYFDPRYENLKFIIEELIESIKSQLNID